MRGSRFLLAGQGQGVLHLAADAVGFGHVLGGNAHVVLVVDVPQAIDNHGVHHIPVAHALAVAAAHQHVGRGAHVFLAAGNDDFAVPIGHRLGGQHDGLEARSAYRVNSKRRCFFGYTAFHQRLARRVLARTGGKHLAHDDFAHLIGRQAGALQQIANDRGAQLGGGHFGQASAKFTYSGAGGSDDDDVLHGSLLDF